MGAFGEIPAYYCITIIFIFVAILVLIFYKYYSEQKFSELRKREMIIEEERLKELNRVQELNRDIYDNLPVFNPDKYKKR